MKFNRTGVKQLRADIDSALAAIEKKHGVEFNIGTIRFSDTDFRATLKCTSADKDAARKMFERDALRVGLKKTAYGKKFKHGSKEYIVVGVNTRAKKYPANVETVNRGDKFKMSVSILPQELRW